MLGSPKTGPRTWTAAKVSYLLLLCLSATGIHAQIREVPHQWSVVIHVVDDFERPVKGAEAWVNFAVPSLEGKPAPERISGGTDSQGMFGASHVDTSVYLGLHAQMPRHYPAAIQHFLGFSADDAKIEWSITRTLMLKPVKNPIAMFAKRWSAAPPATGKPIGYNLETGDWVAPLGQGKSPDIFFTLTIDKRSDDDWDYRLIVSFPNTGDGIQPFVVPQAALGSKLRSPYEAPEQGYSQDWTKVQAQRPGQKAVHLIDENLNFFVRVCTKVDGSGNIKSARYGKIYGDFMDFQYFLNPTPNSRNVEFYPTKNLLHHLKPSEEVVVP